MSFGLSALNLLRDAEDSHFSILHFQNGVFNHELAAHVAVICRALGIHLLQETESAEPVICTNTRPILWLEGTHFECLEVSKCLLLVSERV